MTLTEWLVQPTGRLVTMALLHFVWQGLVIAILLAVFVKLAGIRRAILRYACSLAALLAIALCPFVTAAWLAQPNPAHPLATIADNDRLAPTPLGIAILNLWLPAAQPY